MALRLTSPALPVRSAQPHAVRSRINGRFPLRQPSNLRRRSGAISAVHFEELIEKDWSFLDPVPGEGGFDSLIAAGEVREESKVLVCFPAVDFVDRMVEIRPFGVLIATHDSLLLLAEIKERHDGVRCWQGGVDAVPERIGPFDSVFVCYFPAMGVSIEQLLRSLARRCSPGARVVIGCEYGRDVVKRHRQDHPDVATSDWPSKADLDRAAGANNFKIIELVDESLRYLAVLQLS